MRDNSFENYILADWPAPPTVKALTTTRRRGYSKEPFKAFNLGFHVNDNVEAVIKNHQKLVEDLNLINPPRWLNQLHGIEAVDLGLYPVSDSHIPADASFSTSPNLICAVMTADCVPILICDKQGTLVSAIHAGWRGLLGDIIGNTIKTFPLQSQNNLIAWIGPAIGPDYFEINEDIYNAFIEKNNNYKQAFFRPFPKKWYADLFLLARINLIQYKIFDIYGENLCTYVNEDLFYSYRRDQGRTGRMASLIWLES